MKIENIEDLKKFLKENKDMLKKEFGVCEIGIFGSFTTNDQTSKSDIDIIIEMEPEKKDLHNFLRLKRSLTKKLGRKIDIGFKNSIKPVVYEKIKDKLIYV